MNAAGWLARYYRADYNKSSGEAVFPCPRCDHPRFYFNVKKRVGFCHHDKCHWKCTLADLFERLGEKLEDAFLDDLSEVAPVEIIPEIALPEASQPLVTMVEGKLVSSFPDTVKHIKEDRGIDEQKQYSFNLHVGDGRIFIPVYLEGKLMSYVGRAIWWWHFTNSLRYKYPKGVRITDYLFNWDEAKTWKELTLVENTFNAMWLRDEQVTSNFGSHLSDSQLGMISHGRAESVVLIWDSGAEKAAHKAVDRLRSCGIPACYAEIHGQPDDYSERLLQSIIYECHKAARKGTKCLSFKHE